MITVQINGLSDLVQTLRNLPAEIASKNGGPLARALAKGGRTIRDDAKRRAPVSDPPSVQVAARRARNTGQINKPGRLRDAIVSKRDRNPGARGRTEAVLVTVRRSGKKGAYYAGMVEFGTVKMEAQPYMRPAFEENKKDVAEQFRVDLSAGIDRAVRKARRNA